MEEKDSRLRLISSSTLLYFLLIIILGNLFIIDVAIFGKKTLTSQTIQSQKITETPKNTVTTKVSDTKPTPIIKSSPTPKIVNQGSSNNSSAREFFIPLGSGSSTSNNWEDIPGASAYVDSSLYQTIEKVTFEASLYTPTGNQTANARLYNVTDSHPVWNSEVTIDGGTPQLKISGGIVLDSGSKLYQVQLKTQLGARTNLENARIHIITK